MAYTNIDDPSAYFQTVLWTGDGTAGNAVTFDGNSDMQPDFVWSKRRDSATSHVLKDTSRGGTSDNDLHLVSDLTQAESTYAQYRMDFDSDGFTLDGVGDSGFQGIGTSMVSWAWKCNGGTTSSNTDGSVTSTVQVNEDAGFSIVTWTTGLGGGNHSVGHGLGVKPAMFITKSRGGTSSWWTWHQGLTGDTSYVNLQTSTGELTFSDIWGDGITSSVFGYNYPATVYANQPYIAYCFAEKQGYSKFGKYVGNGNANGAFVYTGFKPEFVIVKRSDSANNWIITDNARGINGANPRLYADLADAEGSAADYIDHLSNGFKIRTSAGSMNTSGGTYIYMAFAENPFTTSTGIPTTAR
jgi:hypothetical protein